jgi:DNA-binding CsgD family transcriptional regulator/tetratricopeptide (TPR) repeat protein
MKPKANPDRHWPSAGIAAARGALERARECYQRRAWLEAWEALSLADRQTPLSGADLELLATCAYLLGRDDDYLQTLERAHGAFLAAGQNLRAARCAFWLGLRLLFRGEAGRASGWYARAHRLLEKEPRDCAEQGYLLLQVFDEHVAAGNLDAAFADVARAAEIGDRCAEPDLSACARHLHGRLLIEQGQVGRGLGLLDEAMLAAATGELSPMATGLTYCSVIDGCHEAYAFRRAREWTDAMTAWCAAQPDMVAFSGVCLVHRAEIMQMRGAWQDAIDEARRAFGRCHQVRNVFAAGKALYQQAEVHRLRGESAEAEQAYGDASRCGCDPQPGLALLRTAQGRLLDAATAIDRALCTTTSRWHRARLLPACVEIMLAAGNVDAARSACDELAAVAADCASAELDAMALYARGTLALAAGDAQAALLASRCALPAWQQAEAPYMVARVRLLAGLACRALRDHDGFRLETDAARAAFEQLGAVPDLARIDPLTRRPASQRPHGLTPRELQVLRLLATGRTNKVIANNLFVSEKTIDRHVSNIFAKLDVPSRAAATGRAYELKLVGPP